MKQFEIPLPAGYPLEHMLKVVARHPDAASERMDGSALSIAFSVAGEPQLMRLHMGTTPIRAELEGEELEAASEIAGRILGLNQDSTGFEEHARRLGHAKLFEGREGQRIPQTTTVFDGFLWVIVGQQVNVTFAAKLRRRVTELVGVPVGDFFCSPEPEKVATLDPSELLNLQFSRQKADYLINVARLLSTGELREKELLSKDAHAVFTALMSVRGFGIWSVNYLMMRTFGFPDCVPLGDTGISTGVKNYFGLNHRPEVGEVAELLAPFAPYRSLASYHLWRGWTR